MSPEFEDDEDEDEGRPRMISTPLAILIKTSPEGEEATYWRSLAGWSVVEVEAAGGLLVEVEVLGLGWSVLEDTLQFGEAVVAAAAAALSPRPPFLERVEASLSR